MVVSYIMINCMIRSSSAPHREEDKQIVFRTIILIGTDMICWLPTLFFGKKNSIFLNIIKKKHLKELLLHWECH